jgi:hypothetical protein
MSAQANGRATFELGKFWRSGLSPSRRVSGAPCPVFCSTITANERRTAWWEVEAFERVVLALETGVLKGSVAARLKVCLGLVEAAGEADASTTTPITLEDRTAMKTCLNAVAHSAVMLEQEQNKRVCQILVELSGPLRSFYTYASKTCRSADGCETCMAHMAGDGVQEHFREFSMNFMISKAWRSAASWCTSTS